MSILEGLVLNWVQYQTSHDIERHNSNSVVWMTIAMSFGILSSSIQFLFGCANELKLGRVSHLPRPSLHPVKFVASPRPSLTSHPVLGWQVKSWSSCRCPRWGEWRRPCRSACREGGRVQIRKGGDAIRPWPMSSMPAVWRADAIRARFAKLEFDLRWHGRGTSSIWVACGLERWEMDGARHPSLSTEFLPATVMACSPSSSAPLPPRFDSLPVGAFADVPSSPSPRAFLVTCWRYSTGSVRLSCALPSARAPRWGRDARDGEEERCERERDTGESWEGDSSQCGGEGLGIVWWTAAVGRIPLGIEVSFQFQFSDHPNSDIDGTKYQFQILDYSIYIQTGC